MFTWIVLMTLCTADGCETENMAWAMNKEHCYELAEVYAGRVKDLPDTIVGGAVMCRDTQAPEEDQPAKAIEGTPL